MGSPPRRIHHRLQWGAWRMDLSSRTHVMGVLNVTPDSFSDGGRYLRPDRALAHAQQMADAGADLIDIGGESTRPGAPPVPLDEELRRVIPVIEKVAAHCQLPISIDTSKAGVARRAIEAGAAMVNDVTALRGDPAMARVVADAGVPVVLMHMRGTPATMQRRPRYRALMDDLVRFFRQRIAAASAAGIDRRRIILDPGLGFGKTLAHNLEILQRLEVLSRLGQPLLIGPSRKSFLGKLLNRSVDQRLEGTAAAVTAAVLHGAHVVRVHDVEEMVRVVRVADAIRLGRPVAG
jgi:dihydropteroate synthase